MVCEEICILELYDGYLSCTVFEGSWWLTLIIIMMLDIKSTLLYVNLCYYFIISGVFLLVLSAVFFYFINVDFLVISSIFIFKVSYLN